MVIKPLDGVDERQVDGYDEVGRATAGIRQGHTADVPAAFDAERAEPDALNLLW